MTTKYLLRSIQRVLDPPSQNIPANTSDPETASQPASRPLQPPSRQKSKPASHPAWRNTSRPGTRRAGPTSADYRKKARHKWAAQLATRSAAAAAGKNCSDQLKHKEGHWVKKSGEEDACALTRGIVDLAGRYGFLSDAISCTEL
jgi:hypothetical protein